MGWTTEQPGAHKRTPRAAPSTDDAPWKLPHGWPDVLRQLLLFAASYALYQVVRGLVGVSSSRPFTNATRVIDVERSLHVFVEPNIQSWVNTREHWLMDVCVWTYINAHFVLTVVMLVFIYMRRNESFYFVRNMFIVAMGIALIGYTVFPTAPPRLMPAWGFTDPIQQITGASLEHGTGSALINPYAAIPSMHVCFAVMIAWPMVRLVRARIFKVFWALYPLFIAFVVVATGNHYFTDVLLGAVTAGASALLSKELLARARPRFWAFAGAPA